MTNSVLQSALKLSSAERILLVEQLWDSINAEKSELSLDQSRELSRRLKRIEKTGPLGAEWSEVKARIKNKKSK